MHRAILIAASSAAVLLSCASPGKAASELIYGFDSPTINGFYIAYDGSDAGNGSVTQSTTTGVTQGTGALHIYAGASSGYTQTDAFTTPAAVDLVLPGTASLNLDLTFNPGAVAYASIIPVFFIEGASYMGGASVDKKLTPAASATGENTQLAGTTLYNGATLTYNLHAYKDPFGATDGDGTTALYTPGQIAAAVNAASPSSLAVIDTFGLETQNGANTGTDYYIDNITIPVATTGSTWSINASGDYNTPSNWGGTVPNAVDAVANLLGIITSNVTVSTAIPVTVGTLNFNNSNTYTIAGAGSLTMQTSTGAATVNVMSGTQSIALPFIIASNTNLNVSSGAALLVSGPVTINAGLTLASTGVGPVRYTSSVTVGSNASFVLTNSTSVSSLTLQTGAKTSVANSSSGRTLLQLGSLSLATGSTIDLTISDMVVHAGSLSTITAAVKSGYAKGASNGTGIQSSTAAASSTHLTTLAVAAFGSGTAITSIDGTALAPGDVIVKYTYYGDANLDGVVDGSDYSRIDSGFISHATGWVNGDFNYDGLVDGSDYTLIDNAFNRQGASITSAVATSLAEPASQFGTSDGTTAVPEPTVLTLTGFGVLGLLRRRRRSQ